MFTDLLAASQSIRDAAFVLIVASFLLGVLFAVVASWRQLQAGAPGARRSRTEPTGCIWTQDDDGVWHTACGQAHVFDTAGPAENHHRYCPYCGKPLVEKPAASDEEDAP